MFTFNDDYSHKKKTANWSTMSVGGSRRAFDQFYFSNQRLNSANLMSRWENPNHSKACSSAGLISWIYVVIVVHKLFSDTVHIIPALRRFSTETYLLRTPLHRSVTTMAEWFGRFPPCHEATKPYRVFSPVLCIGFCSTWVRISLLTKFFEDSTTSKSVIWSFDLETQIVSMLLVSWLELEIAIHDLLFNVLTMNANQAN